MMEFVILPRQAGKTHGLIEWMLAAPKGEARIYVTHNRHDAMRMLREQRGKGNVPPLESWQFMAFQEIRGPGVLSAVVKWRTENIVIGIDNVDMILQMMVDFPIRRVTATGVTAEYEHMLHHYSRALDEIYLLRAQLDFEARVQEVSLDYKTFPKSRRRFVEESVKRMRDSAAGKSHSVSRELGRHEQGYRKLLGDRILTRIDWEHSDDD